MNVKGRKPIGVEKRLIHQNASEYDLDLTSVDKSEYSSPNDVEDTDLTAVLYLHVASEDDEVTVDGSVTNIELVGKCDDEQPIIEGHRITYDGRRFELMQKEEVVNNHIYDLKFKSVIESEVDDSDITYG